MRYVVSIVAGLVLIGAVPAPSAAQPPPTQPPSLDRMKALSLLVGRWEGGGSIRMGPVEPHRFNGSEVVEEMLGGRILVIEGRHWAENPEQLVHHAFAVISWDEKAGHYRFQSHLADGRSGTYQGTLENGAFVWHMEIPNAGRIRYTIRVEEGVWREVGERQQDGTWMPFFEMTLNRAR